ncbi:16S rRNA (guanine(527)-N(7))-methyltransferase RsmG [Salinisphaera orenii]|uniref:16S rRNA (guanine(527)-N(7))-methyltransferase RsmG n=1 Tax=Salinisphaera orenii TaxID=856731 RepID=UPI00296E7386
MAPSAWSDARGVLDAGIETMDSNVSLKARSQLIRYLETLTTWNATYNLTAIREPRAMVVRHILDCVAVLPLLSGRTLADIGSGAGLPGLVVAIARPKIQVTLIESSRKKAAFLRHAKRELGLTNVHIVPRRIEQWHADTTFDIITARAFAQAAECVSAAEHLLAAGGEFMLMKGVNPSDELSELPPAWRIMENRPVSIPGLDGERHVVRLSRGLL